MLGLYGYDGAYRARIAQLRANGQPDGSFGNGGLKAGITPDFNLQDLTMAGGKILVAGRTNGGNNPMIMRLRAGGAPDPTFGSHGIAGLSAVNGYLFDIARDAHGRIVGAGNANTDALILRVHA